MCNVPLYKNKDCSDIIERTISSAKEWDTVCFEPGEYHVSRKILVSKKKNLKLLGNGTTFISKFEKNDKYENYKGVFQFDGCENITIENFDFDTSSPSNSSGEIISVDEDNHSIDVRLYDGNYMDGSQTICAINSFDIDGTPDYLIATYGVTSYEVLNETSIRIYLPEKCAINGVPKGEQICLRHGVGGYKKLYDGTITFKDCTDVVLKDISVYSSVGYMTVVFPRCRNFTFIRYNVVPKNNSRHLMASNVDAIHILGLSGCLTVSDCHFSGLGDDAINIHSGAAYVKTTQQGYIYIENKRFQTPMPDEWCSIGDIISVYNADLLYKGSFKVDAYENSTVCFASCDCLINEGDFLANTSFFAKTVISNCDFKNSRARALLLQTENIDVRNCSFYGISLPAILMSPDVRHWYEVGPVKNALIQNCRFEKCAFVNPNKKNSAISVRTSHDTNNISNSIVHKDITVRDNIFFDCDRAVSIYSTDGVLIEDNKVIMNGEISDSNMIKSSLELCNCINCNVSNDIL